MMDAEKIIFITMFSLGGGGMTAAGAAMFLRRHRLARKGVWTTGEVVALRESISEDSDGDKSTFYYPIFEFEDERGRKLRVEGSTGSSPASYSVHQRVPVVYDRARPESAEIGTFEQLWLFSLILLLIGGVMLAIALGVGISGLNKP